MADKFTLEQHQERMRRILAGGGQRPQGNTVERMLQAARNKLPFKRK